MTDHERLCELLQRARNALPGGETWVDLGIALTRLRSTGPDGIRCVPVEPTKEMLWAADDLPIDSYVGIWKAMLRAGGERADG